MIDQLKPLLGKFTNFAKNKMGFDYPPRLFLKQDAENSKGFLGSTAHYDPQNKAITIFITGRHPKDILRSFAHELVHHTQNLRGDLSPDKCGQMTDKYAQENPHMRKMEEEAYLIGNMCFRDWEDNEKFTMQESKLLKENKQMTDKNTKESLKEMIRKILEQKVSELHADEEEPPGGGETEADSVETPGGWESELSPEEAESGWGDGPKEGESPVSLSGLSQQELVDVMRAALEIIDGDRGDKETLEEEEDLEEQSKTDIPDRVAGRDAGGRRLDEEEEDSITEEGESEDSIEEDNFSSELNGTPEREENLYESRFSKRNANLYEDLVKKWAK